MRRGRVPDEYRSPVPAQLRDLATQLAVTIEPGVEKLLQDAAAEIEGSEEAFAVLVSDVHDLRKQLSHTQALLRSAYRLIPQRSS